MKRWFAVQTQPMAEERAVRHLRMQAFQVFYPRIGKTRRHARRVETVEAPLFPRYLFVEMDMAAQRWRAINGTTGVIGLVGTGGLPTVVPDGVMVALRGRCDEAGLLRKAEDPPFQPGQAVQVTDGPLTEQLGRFHALSDRDRVVVLMELMGRPVLVAVPREAVAACA